MKKSLFASILMVLIGGSFASLVIADDTLVRFQGAIGDIPVSNVGVQSTPTAPSLTSPGTLSASSTLPAKSG